MRLPHNRMPHAPKNTLPKAIATLWLFTLAALVSNSIIVISDHYAFDSDILALLPEEETSADKSLVNKAIARLRDRELIVLVGSEQSENSIIAASEVQDLAQKSQLFESISGIQTQDDTKEAQAFYSPWNFNFISKQKKSRIQTQDESLVSEALGKLFGPAGGIGSTSFLRDPLGLYQDWQISLTKNQHLVIDNNWLTLLDSDITYRFLRLRLKKSSFAPAYQQQIMHFLESLSEQVDDDIYILPSGLIIHAAHGANQAKSEISTIGLGSLLGITIILFIVFRRVADIALVFLPLVLGSVFSFSLCLILFEKIHLITLAFGTSLIGIAIDYSLHYLCAQREHHARDTLQRIFPGLLLALISSVTAYIAQAITPFPGLRQMAVFAALGLIGAWLSVIILLPLIGPPKVQKRSKDHMQSIAQTVEHIASTWAQARTGQAKYFLWIIGLLLLLGASQIQIDDNLKSLQTSPQHLIDNDIRIGRLLKSESIGNYFLVRSADEQTLLENEERLVDRLEQAKHRGLIQGYRATSEFIPSIRTQRENYTLLQEQVYTDNGLLDEMFEATGMQQLTAILKRTFTESSFTPLSFDVWKRSSIAKQLDSLWIGRIGKHDYSMVSLIGSIDEHTDEELSRIASAHEGISYINRPKSITKILEQYRESLFGLLIFAYALVTILLLLRYRTAAIDIIAPSFFATLVVLSYLASSSTALTVFHCLALLLVLGIGLDAAIFLKETQSSAYTWLAVSLSSITTFLAFGLLSLSQTPVLHFFGQTVAVGIVAIWFIVPLFCVHKDNNNAAS